MRYPVLTLSPICLYLAGIPACAQASIPEDAPAQSLADSGQDLARDLVVTALPDPLATPVYGREHLDAQTIMRTASGRIEDALARLAGFQQFRRSDGRSANLSSQGVTLRAIGGNASSRTLVLRDGIPMADAFFGFIPFSALSASELARVTVTRGSGTGPFGAGAIAGVLSLESHPLASRPRYQASMMAGSNATFRGDGALTLPLGAGHVAIDIHHERSDGFYTTPAEERVAATARAAYTSSAAAIAAAIPVSDTLALEARVGAFRDKRQLRFAGADNGGEGLDASWRLTGSGRWQWEMLGWVQARDFSNIVISSTSFHPTLDQRATPTTGWGLKGEVRPPLGEDQSLRLGVDMRGAQGEAIEDVLVAATGARSLTRRASGSTRLHGVWGEYDRKFGPWTMTGGARLDHWQLDDGMLLTLPASDAAAREIYPDRQGTLGSFRGGIAFQASESLLFRAAAYTGFRLPTLNELYRGFTVFPVVTRANPALRPERLRGVELAVEWQVAPGMAFGLTGFDNRLKDAIGNVSIGPNLRERQNLDAIHARGLEANLQLTQGPWRLATSWAYSDAHVEDVGTTEPLRPAQSPQWSGGAELGWTSPWQTEVTLAMRHVGMQFEDDRNIDRLPAATSLDVIVSQKVRQGLTARVAVENITDSRVVTRNSGGSTDLGAPRLVWFGLTWAH